MNKGFTIIELLITIAIFSILIVMPISGFTSIAGSANLKGAAGNVAAKLNMIKQKAVSSSSITELSCGANTYKIRRLDIASNAMKDEISEKLPNNINFEKNVTFRFSSSGFPQPGYFGTAIIKDASGRSKKIIVSSLGRIRIE